MLDLIQHVRERLLDSRCLRRGDRIVVGVSGGIDSVVLAHVLLALSKEEGWRLLLAHFNHRLRNEASDLDEAFVRGLGRRWGLGVAVGSGEVLAAARAGGVSLEMAARDLRHGFLANTARAQDARVILLAHHADDQVETYLLNLLRGSGARGLAGMREVSHSPSDPSLWLLRPFLQISRTAIHDYAQANGLEFCDDESNRDTAILRNRVRHELLPLLATRYQSSVRKILLRTMELESAEADWLDSCAEEWLGEGEGVDPFPGLHVALQRAIVRRQLIQLSCPISYGLVERLRKCPGKEFTVGTEQIAQLQPNGRVLVRPLIRLAFRQSSLVLDLVSGSGRAEFGGCTVEWERRDLVEESWRDLKCGEDSIEIFDDKYIGNIVELRFWRSGDRFQPSGFRQPAKLQDLFTNAKVPASERRLRILAILPNADIFWVEGLRIGENQKCGPNTRRVLLWRWKRNSSPEERR